MQSTGAERSSSIDIDNNCFIQHFYLAVLPKRIIIGLCWTILILYSLLEFFGTRNNCFGIAVQLIKCFKTQVFLSSSFMKLLNVGSRISKELFNISDCEQLTHDKKNHIHQDIGTFVMILNPESELNTHSRNV